MALRGGPLWLWYWVLEAFDSGLLPADHHGFRVLVGLLPPIEVELVDGASAWCPCPDTLVKEMCFLWAQVIWLFSHAYVEWGTVPVLLGAWMQSNVALVLCMCRSLCQEEVVYTRTEHRCRLVMHKVIVVWRLGGPHCATRWLRR